MSLYRMSLPPHLRIQRALVILDGHLSRECPLALIYLALHGIDILTLPAHTTHVLQMFDVGMASPLNAKFTELIQSLLNQQTH